MSGPAICKLSCQHVDIDCMLQQAKSAIRFKRQAVGSNGATVGTTNVCIWVQALSLARCAMSVST